MSEHIQFYYNPQSRGRIVHWMLEEIGAPYDIKMIDLGANEHKSSAYLAINPMGKIPALVHRGTVITESAAICAYLADAFPAANLAPTPDDAARGTYYRWLFFGAGCVEPALADKMLGRPAVTRPGALGYGTYADTMSALETAVTPGPFILGESFTAVDVYIASQIGWGKLTNSIEPRPVLFKYLERCTDRPAYRRFVQKAEELAQAAKKK